MGEEFRHGNHRIVHIRKCDFISTQCLEKAAYEQSLARAHFPRDHHKPLPANHAIRQTGKRLCVSWRLEKKNRDPGRPQTDCALTHKIFCTWFLTLVKGVYVASEHQNYHYDRCANFQPP